MAKITVILRCRIDNGKEVINPGEAVSMDEAQARNLAAMGMVELPEEAEAKPAKQLKKQGKQPAAKSPAGEGTDDDAGQDGDQNDDAGQDGDQNDDADGKSDEGEGR